MIANIFKILYAEFIHSYNTILITSENKNYVVLQNIYKKNKPIVKVIIFTL